MRYDPLHKQKTRERVVKEAGKAIRADGPHRVGVAGVMAKAGLTHGGFYAHFGSKDELVAAAIEEMFRSADRRFAAVTAGRAPRAALGAYLDFYLSPEHRDGRASGCPATALAADLPRLTGAARESFAKGVESLNGHMAELLAKNGRQDAVPMALSVFAELVGALSLARAVGDPEQSDLILKTSRSSLKRRLGLDDPGGDNPLAGPAPSPIASLDP